MEQEGEKEEEGEGGGGGGGREGIMYIAVITPPFPSLPLSLPLPPS